MNKYKNRRNDTLGKLIRKKVENEAIEFDPAAWEAMEKKLDEHMPTCEGLTKNKSKEQLFGHSEPTMISNNRKKHSQGVKKTDQNDIFREYNSTLPTNGNKTGQWIYNLNQSKVPVGAYYLKKPINEDAIKSDEIELKMLVKLSQKIYSVSITY